MGHAVPLQLRGRHRREHGLLEQFQSEPALEPDANGRRCSQHQGGASCRMPPLDFTDIDCLFFEGAAISPEVVEVPPSLPGVRLGFSSGTGQTRLKSLYSPRDRRTDKKRRSHLCSAGAKRRRMAGAGRILKKALAVAASAACLSRSRRSCVALAVAAGRRTDKDSTATDSDSDFPRYCVTNCCLYPCGSQVRLRLKLLRRNG